MNNLVNTIQIPRSYRHIKPIVTTTFNAGDVVPFYNMEILPNDKISLSVTSVTNMTTPNFATMDTLEQQIAFFYCPNRLVWENWDKFYGAGKNNDYDTFVQLFVPQITCPEGGWAVGTIGDYLGLPTGRNIKSVSALPFRMFALIYNEYYRDEQRQAKCLVSKDDNDIQGVNSGAIINYLQNGCHVPNASRLFDYFTGSKLEFQAGDPVTIPIGNSAPVNLFATPSDNASGYSDLYLKSQATNGSITAIVPFESGIGISGKKIMVPYEYHNSDGEYAYRYQGGISGTADLTQVTGITIRDFKRLLMLQQELQNLEDGGTRYIEQLFKRWGVYADELQLEIPQFLGARNITLNMNMVVSTTENNNTKLGQLSGMSNTFDDSKIFTKRFKQHGWLFGIVVIRPHTTYEDGIPRSLVKKSIDDFYKPEMAYFGPDIIYNYEIYSDASDNKDDEMFGVRNYGDYLRFIPNRVTGQMRTGVQNTQAYKTYSKHFTSRPLNNNAFIQQSELDIDKTLTTASTTGLHQFTFQAQMDIKMVRNLPKNPNAEQLIRL